MWDFTVVTPKRGRTNGKATPLKQKKVREVTGKAWIKTLRHELAAITNRHLAAARVERRLDPRRYTEMGIVADPQEHLGTNQAAAETRGEATKTGTSNELRQWRAIMAEGDARYRLALADADERVVRYRERQAKAQLAIAVDETADALRQHLHQAAELEFIAFKIHHGLERARSRASHVRQANRQLCQAFDADPSAGRRSERDRSKKLTADAAEYLDQLNEYLADERALLDDCQRNAHALTRAADLIELDELVAPTVSHATALVAKTEPTRAVDKTPLRVAQEQLGPDRAPLQSKGEEASNVDRVSQPQSNVSSNVKLTDAARRAAIAAAARSAGR